MPRLLHVPHRPHRAQPHPKYRLHPARFPSDFARGIGEVSQVVVGLIPGCSHGLIPGCSHLNRGLRAGAK
jgi:hypothetical protein